MVEEHKKTEEPHEQKKEEHAEETTKHSEHKEASESRHEEHKTHEHHKVHEHKPVHEHKTTDSQHVHHIKPKPKKSGGSGLWMGLAVIFAILWIFSLFSGGSTGGDSSTGDVLSEEEASQKAVEFINENILPSGQEAEISSIEEEGDLYKVKLSIQGQEFDSYMTKDGGLLFPSAVDLNEVIEETEESDTPTTPETQDPEMEKMEVPEVELFVMSHCPFGTQIEKGFIPVAELLGDKIDYEVKFVYYAMHGEKELKEQLNQYCIQQTQKEKYIDYLTCFLGEGDGEACLDETGIDTDAVEKCVTETDEEYKVMENFADQSTWLSGRYPLWDVQKAENEAYGVRGSPNLVVNGQTVSSGRDAASLLSAICNGFEEPPAECDESLDSASPSPGFGFTASSGTATDATCG
jgi:glutaredoxin